MKSIDKDKIPVQSLLIPKPILYLGKVLNFFSPFVASRFAARIFLTPFRYDMPDREKEMYEHSQKEYIHIDTINRDIMLYQYGTAPKKILLVHGWSGTGTQLSKIAKALIDQGYSTISFDAPAHGKSPGKRTLMPHFIKTVHYIEEKYGPFEAAIGHSLGGMSLLRCVKDGLSINKLVIIGTANSITAITQNFVKNMELSPKTGRLLKAYFDKRYGEDLDNYSGAVSAKDVKTPTLIMHDRQDVDVHYSAAHEIENSLINSKIYLTENLGHRRILGDPLVIKKIQTFITE